MIDLIAQCSPLTLFSLALDSGNEVRKYSEPKYISYHTTLYCIVLYCIVLHCIVLNCIIFYYIILYYII